MRNSIKKTSLRPPKDRKQYHFLTPEVVCRLDSFFEVVGPGEFREQLIELFHSYLLHERRSLPKNFEDLSESIVLFLDVLKFMEKQRVIKVLHPEGLIEE